jgi:hypothetical protein
MRHYLAAALLVVAAATGMDAADSLTFQGMIATYSGEGTLRLGTPVADYLYTLVISGPTNATGRTGTLRIKPKNASIRNAVFIDTIYSALPVNIDVKFPPGLAQASYVRNIYINGPSDSIKITGGDLGAPEAEDGRVLINGELGTLKVSGRTYNVPNTTLTEWWGGNVWADIYVYGPLKKLQIKGGDLHYDPHGGILGSITTLGDIGSIMVEGYAVKTNRSMPLTKLMFGGSINTAIDAEEYIIKQLQIKGGALIGSEIDCLQMSRLDIKGRKSADPPHAIAHTPQGMYNVYVTAKDTGGGGQDSVLKNLTIKNGALHDSRFANKGHIRTFKITGETVQGWGTVSNTIFRAGYVGSLTPNTDPTIVADVVSTSIYGGNTLRLPFIVNSSDTDEVLTVRLHFRDRAVNALISNDLGQVFYGTNRWLLQTRPATGHLVWATSTQQLGGSSNIIVRVHDNGIPYKHADLTFSVYVTTNEIPPILLLTPPENPRTYVRDSSPLLFWTAAVADPALHGKVTYGVEGAGAFVLGIIATNTTDKDGYYYTPTQPPLGTYSNIIFRVTEGVFTDTKNITLIVVSNNVFSLTTSLPDDICRRAVNTAFDFTVDIRRHGSDVPQLLARNLPTHAAITPEFIRDDRARYRVTWIPRHTDVGMHRIVFQACNDHGVCFDTLPVTLDVPAAPQPSPAATAALRDWEGSYDGDISTVNVVGDAYDSAFVGSASVTPSNDWVHAIFFGRVKSVNIQGAAYSNVFASLKKIAIARGKLFDFINNAVWINGKRATDNKQQ